MNEEKGKSRCSDGERIPNVIILSLGILILQLYHLPHIKKIVLNSVKVSNWKRFTIWSKLDTPETD